MQGKLKAAVEYLRQFPEKTERCNQYLSVFEQEKYLTYEVDDYLNEILRFYQMYYRDIFWMELEPENAVEKLKRRLLDFFDSQNRKQEQSNRELELDEIEKNEVVSAFVGRGYQFLGGRTGGYYGPYIWRITEEKTYNVELPEGVKEYTVKFLDGFISNSWIDYISFGEISTGGWTDGDGIINCVKASYDVNDESFRVSLLKHEAQHAMDLARDKCMSSEKLEYRAKLVELIYSKERNLLKQFIYEAGSADTSASENGHVLAARRIVDGFSKRLGKNRRELEELSVEEIQAAAEELFAERAVN